MRRSLAFCVLLGLSACGSTASSTGNQPPAPTSGGPVASKPTSTSSGGAISTSTAATVGSTTSVLAPLPDAVLEDPLVRFQADWFCQSSKTAYASAADIDSALAVRLASSGIERAAYDTFVASLGVDNLRRAGVLQVFLQTCH